jgi:hypothetical protein
VEEEGGRVMVGRRGWEVVGVLATLDGSEVCASGISSGLGGILMVEFCFRYLHQRRTPRNETAATRRREIAPRALSSGCREEGWTGVEREGREKGEEGRIVRVAVWAHCVIPLEAIAHNTSAPESATEGCGQEAVRWCILSKF